MAQMTTGKVKAHTVERSFRADASRSRDSSPDGETEGERLRRYQQSTMDEVSDPEYWQSVHHFESSSTEEWTRREALHAEEGEGNGLRGAEGEEARRGEGGEEESMVGPTPEGESLSEHGEGRSMRLSLRVSQVNEVVDEQFLDEQFVTPWLTQTLLQRRLVVSSTLAITLT